MPGLRIKLSHEKTNASAEEGLRKVLTDVNYFPSNDVKALLEALPAGEANDLLARIAEDADRERPTFWSYGFAVFWLILTFDSFIDLPSGRKVKRRQAGIRAALYLARRGDLRSVVPLARSWASALASKSEHQEQIEQSLIQLLSRTPPGRDYPLPSGALVDLSQRVWRARRRWRDLSSGQTDLLLALIRHLDTRSGEVRQGLQMLQDSGSGTNRAQVRAAARQALTDPA